MRLLRVDEDRRWTLTKDLVTPPGPYAILSHTWGLDEDEVTFEDVTQNLGATKAGMTKLWFCANAARNDGLEYFWIDTCCINKANHVELSEAITSMFRWYRQAAKCYVYLSDVSSGAEKQWTSAFCKSRWFTRGWTLQELLAPRLVEFFSREQALLGSKTTLESLIHDITQIPRAALQGASLSQFTIDERLRWAHGRHTARVEDKAYCLLGIFDVSMSLRYGEGDKAHGRLEKKVRGSSKGQRGLVDWLAPSRPQTIHAKTSSHRHPETGTTFTQGPLLYWLGKVSAQGSLMWITGKSGAGKTTLFSWIVEATKSFSQEVSAQVFAYHYCAVSDPESRQLVNILGSLVAQISAWQPNILDNVRDIFERDAARGRPKTLEAWELEQLLIQCISRLSTVVFLFDALNESDDAAESYDCLARLLQRLPNLKVLATSTTRAPTSETSQQIDLTEIQINPDQDIETFVDFQLINHVALRYLSPDFKVVVRSTLIKKADHSFRWVALTIDNLRKQRTGQAVVEALAKVPQGLNATYASMLDMIPDTDKNIVREALLWLCFAMRPLSLLELSEAAILEESLTTLDEQSRLHRPEDVLDICHGFIEYNKEIDEIKLAHASVRDYLLSDHINNAQLEFFGLGADEGNRRMMHRCLTYLMFDDFKQGGPYFSGMMARRGTQFPLLSYAALFWGQHASHVTNNEWDLARKFFATRSLPGGGNYGAWVAYLIPDCGTRAVLATDPLYYAASFGIVPLVRTLIAESSPTDIERPGGRAFSTPLQVACFRGRREAAECLLNAGANFWSVDTGSGRAAWFWAQSNGWTTMVERMVQLRPQLAEHVNLDTIEKQGARRVQERLLARDLARVSRDRALARSSQ